MTKQQYLKWRDQLPHSEWKVDSIHNKLNDCIFFNGSEDGKFIMIVDNWLSIGNYEFAVPSIGDANFKTIIEKEFVSNEVLWNYLLKRSGLNILNKLKKEKVK